MWGDAMDLGEWLRGLGLGQYEATFREHEIDADVLPDLTEADLEKIGLPLGTRKKLMKGIAGLASKKAPPSAADSHGRFRVKWSGSSAHQKLRWLFRYPRSEPYFMSWLVPHQIKLTSGRRSKQLHQYPAFGGWGSGGRDHSFTRLFKPVHCSVRSPGSVRTG